MTERDPHEVLGVPKGADAATVRKAWKALARAYHPDRNPGDAAAEARFKEAAQAFAILSDPDARDRWARSRANAAYAAPSSAALARLVAEARDALDEIEEILFDRVLPAYVERLERGEGLEMRWVMLDDLDHLRFLAFVQENPKPGIAARQRAATLRGPLQVRLDPATVVDEHGELRIASGISVRDRDVRWAAVHVHLGSIAAADIPVEDLRVKLLPAVWREVLRYLDEELPPSWRVQEVRAKRGSSGMPFTREQARAADSRVVRGRVFRAIGAVALAAGVFAVLSWLLGR